MHALAIATWVLSVAAAGEPAPAGTTPEDTAGAERPKTPLEIASCAPDNLDFHGMLMDADTLALRGEPGANGPWGGSESIGCARVATAPGGELRIWTARFAQIEPRYSEVRRGFAVVQWRDDDGMHTWLDGDEADLALDGIVDGIAPVPGVAGEWLVTGLRWKGTWLRWAQVLKIDGESVSRVPGRFLANGAKRDVLFFESPFPEETGKMRHSAVWNRWLRLDAKGELGFEDAPKVIGEPAPRATVARWKNGRFEVSGSKWGAISFAKKPPADCP